MADAVSPSAISEGKIGKFLELQAAALRKSGLPGAETQQVLETQGGALADEFVTAVRKRVEAISSLITRIVRVVRSRTPQAALEATSRIQYVDKAVVKTMPNGEGDEATLYFFKADRYLSDPDLEKEYELRGLKAADPYSLAAVNEADPAFADGHPNGTHWKDADDRWCYATFHRWLGERSVNINRSVSEWSVGWWFAGVRK